MTASIRRLALAAAVACGSSMLLMPVAGQPSVASPTPIHPSVPTLHLSDADRAKIRTAVAQENTGVSFALKASKGAESFVPALGAKLPKGVTPHPLPRPLIYELPVLRQFKYVKFKDQVLIVNPISNEIVDLFPWT
jgi:hypothetical protein